MSTYVAQGLAYFLAHPELWRMTICPVLLTVVVGMTTVIVLLAAAMPPQEQALYDAGVPEGLAWVLAIMLCLVESFVIVMIYSLICLACYQDKVFEFVMRKQGHEELVDNKRRHASCIRICTSCCRIVAWEYHFFYFELKNLTFEQQQALINDRGLQYTLFGMQALLLEMVPGIGAVFMFANTVGAALFASSIEREEAAKHPNAHQQEESESYRSLA
ncbi:hypothetical protein PF005_g12532 [Phytophthora fragariae]|uniref:Uncharacterized protein n=1 Tax=Phytophthora fragariae TaxID=53985 RepID=A0A6A4BIW7_9STRA|nr:hypothetical protein PF003_g39431 [Phytophthora fragariae]KAE8938217.1 hypothetical protein PF009_g11901 [Phytophthora fragariae]KAE8971580.1 hypothetical protein PF011_g25986 [Phytophthora fragariae]KAE9111958.1 hypothetical protein PF007_g11287 [Phytophthora fragariae]KAE9125240.1 hypothetical protein PF006_g17004 [Phytophthora fragariae]